MPKYTFIHSRMNILAFCNPKLNHVAKIETEVPLKALDKHSPIIEAADFGKLKLNKTPAGIVKFPITAGKYKA